MSTTCRWRRRRCRFWSTLDPASGYVRADRAGPDHDERGQVRVCLRMEYDAAAEKGRAVYPPEKLTTEGSEVLRFLGAARGVSGGTCWAAGHKRAGRPRSQGSSRKYACMRRSRSLHNSCRSSHRCETGTRAGRRQVFLRRRRVGARRSSGLLKEFDVPFVAASDELQARSSSPPARFSGDSISRS